MIIAECKFPLREKYKQNDYHEVITPQIFDLDLFHQSGHYANYRENMYFTKITEKTDDFWREKMGVPPLVPICLATLI